MQAWRSSGSHMAIFGASGKTIFKQLSTSSIRSYIRAGKLKAFRIAGKRKVLIQRADLMALLE